MVFIEYRSSHLIKIKIIHKLLYYCPPSLNIFLSAYFSYNKNDNKKLQVTKHLLYGRPQVKCFTNSSQNPLLGTIFIPFRWGNTSLENSINLTIITEPVNFGVETQTPVWTKAYLWIWEWVEVVVPLGTMLREETKAEESGIVGYDPNSQNPHNGCLQWSFQRLTCLNSDYCPKEKF